MNKIICVFLLLILSLTNYSFNEVQFKKVNSGIEFKEISLKKALKLAEKENKIILLYFHAKWCGPCRSMAATTFLDKQVTEFYNKEAINIKLDVDNEEVKELGVLYEVNSVPFFVIINNKSKPLLKIRGYQEVTDFLAFGKEAKERNIAAISKSKIKK